MKKIYTIGIVFLMFIFTQNSLAQGPWTFTNSNDGWASTGTNANVTPSATYSVLDINGAGNPQITRSDANVDGTAFNFAIIKIKNNTSNTLMRFIYNTSGTNRFTDTQISASDTEFKTYYVKVDNHVDWNTNPVNNITIQFRADHTNSGISASDDGLGNIYIYDVTFTKYKWTFDAASSDWSRDNATSLVYNGTNATLTLKTNNTGYNGIKTTVGIVGENYPYLVVRIQNSSDRGKLRVRFDKDDDSGYLYKTIDISTNDNDFKTYLVNMGSSLQWNTSGIKDDITIQIGTNTTNPGTTTFDDVRFISSSKDISQLTFDGDADYQTLSAANGSSVTNNDGYATWTLDGTNNNAKLEMKTNGFYYTIDADTHKLVTVELVNVSANDQLAFVSTSSGQEFTSISMNTNDVDNPTGAAQSIIFNIEKDGWSGATNNKWFLRARNSSNSNAVEVGKIYVKSITFSDNTTPIETITDGDWANSATWYGGVIPSFKQTVKINHQVSASSYLNMRSMTIVSGKSFMTNQSFTGEVTYKRNLGTENWYLVSSPVAGETYDDAYVVANSLAINGSNNAISTYASASNDWSYMQTGDAAANFIAGQGYSVRRETGQSTGDISFTGTINSTSVETPSLGSGYNLIGNPYTSYISSATFLGASNSSNLDQTQIWLWNEGLDDYEVKTAGTDWVLSPTQGFFVKATSAGTATFDKSNQATTGNTFQRTSKTVLKLWITDGEKNRYTKIDYIANGTKGFDYGFEGETFGGVPNSLSVFTHLLEDNQGKNYQVQTLPNADYESMIIPVGVIAAADKELTFRAEVMNFPTDLKVYLEDRDNNTFTRLDEANTEYKITVSNTLNGIERFYLHTSQKVLSAAPNFVAEHVSIYKTNSSTLRIVGLSQEKSSVKLFNILGKEVLNTSFNSNGLKDVALPRLAKGVYVVQLTTEAFKVNKKIILE